jgi:hypothetical protein
LDEIGSGGGAFSLSGDPEHDDEDFAKLDDPESPKKKCQFCLETGTKQLDTLVT